MMLLNRAGLGFSTESSKTAKDLRKGERTKAALHEALCRCVSKSEITQFTVPSICKKATVYHGKFYIYFFRYGVFTGRCCFAFQ